MAVKSAKPFADKDTLKVGGLARADPQCLMCELKVLCHLGSHRHIVSLLGAVTGRLNTREWAA